MSNKFLSLIADEVLKKIILKKRNVAIVLPSKRSIQHLKKEISKKLDNPIFLPRILTIEQFIIEIANIEVIDNLCTLTEFFKIFSESDDKKKFDEFYDWAQILLNDFSDVDLGCVDSSKIFRSLLEVKQLESWTNEEWSFNNDHLTNEQENYLTFYSNFKKWYDELYQSLISKNKAYKGMAYRIASEKIFNYQTEYEKIWFVGLNALTQSEEKIIDNLKNRDIARVYWDTDKYYFENIDHEAGDFLRKQKRKWSDIDFKGVSENMSVEKDEFNIISCSDSIGQANAVYDLLARIPKNEIVKGETIIVLPDESKLLSVIHHLPKNISELNVTLGYPLKSSQIIDYVISLLKLNSAKSDSVSFYYVDLLNILNNSLTQKIIDNKKLEKVIKKINNENLVNIDPKLNTELNTNHKLFTKKYSNVNDLVPQIVSLLSELLEIEKNVFQREIFIKVIDVLVQLQSLFESIEITIDSFLKLYTRESSKLSVTFKGNSMSGLQVMGILESRVLDFKNVIFIDLNEGILPKNQTSISFIPYDLKIHFGINYSKRNEAIFAYHFYRILQRARKVSLIYQTKSDSFSFGEKSRFITQLESEYKSTHINYLNYESELSYKENIYEIENKGCDELIDNWLISGISASSITTYFRCPVSFYCKYILGIKEPAEVEENINPMTFGNLAHSILEKIYPHKILNVRDFKKMNQGIDLLIKDEMFKILGTKDLRGINYANFKMAKELITKMLDYEMSLIKKGAKIEIIDTERKIDLEINTANNKIKFFAIIDRIDRFEKNLRVIDYKTGRVDYKELNFKYFDNYEEIKNKPKAFQLLFYLFLASNCDEMKNEKIISANISLKEIDDGFKFLNNGQEIFETNNNFQKDFLNLIETIIREIRTKDYSSCQSDSCIYCKNLF